MRRSEQRRKAIFALYQHDLTDRPLDEMFDRDAPEFTRALAHATDDRIEELDEVIGRYAEGWTVGRIAPRRSWTSARGSPPTPAPSSTAPSAPATAGPGRPGRWRWSRDDARRS